MKIVKTLFLCFLFITTQSADAQKIGLKTGFLLNDLEQKINTTIENPNIVNVQPDLTIGYLVGGMYRAKVYNFFSLQVELSYQQKGGKFQNFYNEKTKFHYLDLSVLGLFKVLDDTTIDFGMGNSFIKKDLIKSHDVGLIGGVSHFVSNKVELSMRYFYGLPSISTTYLSDATGADTGTIKLYNRNVQLSFGYYFL